MIEFLRYLVAAGTASLVDFCVAQTLLFLPALQSGWAFAVPITAGAAAGICVNFLLSRRYVFRPDRRKTVAQMRTFFIISLSTLVLRLVVAFSLVTLFYSLTTTFFEPAMTIAPAERLAQVSAMGIVAVYSFFAHKHISFSGGIRRWLGMT